MSVATHTDLPVLASLAVRDVLGGPPRPARVVARYARALYLDVADTDRGEVERCGARPGEDAHTRTRPHSDAPDHLLAVVAPGGVPVPASVQLIASAGPWWPDAGPQQATIGDGVLRVGAHRLVVRRWWDPVPVLVPTTVTALEARLAHVASMVDDRAIDADLIARLARLTHAIERGELATAVEVADGLLGRGPGLTPTGDDLLAGLLTATGHLAAAVADGVGPAVHDVLAARCALVAELAAQVVASAWSRTTTVSAALLVHAARGASAAPFVGLLQALSGRGELGAATAAAMAIGASSGRDLTRGVLAAGHLVTRAASSATAPPIPAGARTGASTPVGATRRMGASTRPRT